MNWHSANKGRKGAHASFLLHLKIWIIIEGKFLGAVHKPHDVLANNSKNENLILFYEWISLLGYDWKRNFCEPELNFVDPVPVKPEPELHLEILVPVIRTGTVVPEFQFEPESQRETHIFLVF